MRFTSMGFKNLQIIIILLLATLSVGFGENEVTEVFFSLIETTTPNELKLTVFSSNNDSNVIHTAEQDVDYEEYEDHEREVYHVRQVENSTPSLNDHQPDIDLKVTENSERWVFHDRTNFSLIDPIPNEIEDMIENWTISSVENFPDVLTSKPANFETSPSEVLRSQIEHKKVTDDAQKVDEDEEMFEEPTVYANEEDLKEISKSIDEIRKVLIPNSESHDFDQIHEMERLSSIFSKIKEVGREVDLVLHDHRGESKKMVALQMQFEDLWIQMQKQNDTLHKHFEDNAYNRTQIAILLLKDGQTDAAAQEVTKIHDDSKISDIVSQFYNGHHENIVKIITFTHNLNNPKQEIISFYTLHSEMAKNQHTHDPGVLAILERLKEIQNLPDFQQVKLASGVVRFDAFRTDLDREANALLTDWQAQIKSNKYDTVLKFARSSIIYSNCLNNNLLRLLWTSGSFESKYEFLGMLPHPENKLAGFKSLKKIYEAAHMYDNLIKLGLIVRDELEKLNFNHSFRSELTKLKDAFWSPVKKLIWSKSCSVQHVWTKRYLRENIAHENSIPGYEVETVNLNEGDSKTNNSNFRWSFVPSKDKRTFEIRNAGTNNALHALDEQDKGFSSWSRKLVTSIPRGSHHRKNWTVLISDYDEKFLIESDYGFLTTGGLLRVGVFADDSWKMKLEDYDINEFLKLYNRWDLDCY